MGGERAAEGERGFIMSVIDKLKIWTDEWIDDGNVCNQTVVDMRNALIELLGDCEAES